MIKKQVTYENFEGKEVTETLRFNLSKAEMIRMQAHSDVALEDKLKKIIEDYEENADVGRKNLFDFFEELIRTTYGVVKDGMFIKDPVETARFMASEAYSEFLLSLMSNEGEASAFVSGIMPKIKDATPKLEVAK